MRLRSLAGTLLAIVVASGCASIDWSVERLTPQEECERWGGAWRIALAHCEVQTSGPSD